MIAVAIGPEPRTPARRLMNPNPTVKPVQEHRRDPREDGRVSAAPKRIESAARHGNQAAPLP
ncbi:MAG: hypothetical protein LBS49_11750 [Candidatus Accumulibacter sp.]|jgi:hypothetical protein|nr:hypothetical protein [Accumulibacter sp.]